MPREFILSLARKFIGIPYIWGGQNPHVGFDCSGFVIWVLQVFKVLPSGDWTADGLSRYFARTLAPLPGDLAIYGVEIGNVHTAYHVMMVADYPRVIGASGGGRQTMTEADAKLIGAMVKEKSFNYRKDFLFFVDISARLR
jgi:cell wall-associated NlpC family hydrolase